MITRLRIRISAVIMTVLTIIIAGVAAGIYFIMQSSENSETDKLLDYAMEAENGNQDKFETEEMSDPPQPRRAKNELFKPADINWIAISADENGTVNVRSSSRFNELTDTAPFEAAYERILSLKKERGYITVSDVKYRYLFRNGRVVLANHDLIGQTMDRLLVIIVIISLAAWLVLLLVIVLLSGWIVRPIAEAWQKQKDFFADASHELKTPLTVISANVDVIMSNPDEKVSEQSRWFGYIKAEEEKMSGLISQMLYLSREDMMSRRDETAKTEFDLSETAEGVCLAFEALAFEKGKELVTDIKPDVVCRGNKEEISRLINILIDNGIKHSDEGGRIEVRLEKIRNKAVLTVSNTGAQLSEEQLSRVFDRFYKIDKSRGEDKEGYGLGLSIAKTIAEKNEGSLSVQSDEQGLTCFVFKM
ncbi:MAG: HAMP domain-containing sensor histidine kinase [Oscillospiraceae bacterium]|nr:HAMP domain-containing sensor histidine kinase [Oscillospiraceae bacterium]